MEGIYRISKYIIIPEKLIIWKHTKKKFSL